MESYDRSDAITLAIQMAHNLGERFAHVSHVHDLALSLFKQAAAHSRFESGDEEILRVASLLHDIGYMNSPDGKSHHEHSEQIILNTVWPCWEPHAVRICACVAKLHRKKFHYEQIPQQDFSSKQRQLILKLSAILRIADALDRSHKSVVRDILLTRNLTGDWTIQVVKGEITQEELYGFYKKRDLWCEIYGEVSLLH